MNQSQTQREKQIKKLLEAIKNYKLPDEDNRIMKKAHIQMQQHIQKKFRASQPNQNYRFPFSNLEYSFQSTSDNQNELISDQQNFHHTQQEQIYIKNAQNSKSSRLCEAKQNKLKNLVQRSQIKGPLINKGKQNKCMIKSISIDRKINQKQRLKQIQKQKLLSLQKDKNKNQTMLKNCQKSKHLQDNHNYLRLSLKISNKKPKINQINSNQNTGFKISQNKIDSYQKYLETSPKIRESHEQLENDVPVKSKLKIKKMNTHLNSTHQNNQVLKTQNNINSKSYFQYTYEGKTKGPQRKLNYHPKYQGHAKAYAQNLNLNKTNIIQKQSQNQEADNLQSFCSKNLQNMDQNICLNMSFKKYDVEDLKQKIREQSQEKKQFKVHKRADTEGRQIKIRLFQNQKYQKNVSMKTEANEIGRNKTPDCKSLNKKTIKSIVSSNNFLNKTLNCLKSQNRLERTLSNCVNQSHNDQKHKTVKISRQSDKQNKQNIVLRVKDNKVKKSNSSTKISSVLQGFRRKELH